MNNQREETSPKFDTRSAPYRAILGALLAFVVLVVLIISVRSEVSRSTVEKNLVIILDVAPRGDASLEFETARAATMEMLDFLTYTEPLTWTAAVVFDEAGPAFMPFTDYPRALRYDIRRMAAPPADIDIDLGEALQIAQANLEGRRTTGQVLVISNRPPGADDDTSAAVLDAARALDADGHCFYTVGVGDYDAALLQQVRELAPCERADEFAEGGGIAHARGAVFAIGSVIGNTSPRFYEGVSPAGEVAQEKEYVPHLYRLWYLSVFPDVTGLEFTLAEPGGEQTRRMRKVNEGFSRYRIYNPSAGTWTINLNNPTGEPVGYTVITFKQLNETLQNLLDSKAALCLGMYIPVLVVVVIAWSTKHVRRGRRKPPAEAAPAEAVLIDHRTKARYPLGTDTERAVRIGSAADCDVRLDGPGVEPHHAVIHYGQLGQYFIQNQAGVAGTLLNGRPVGVKALNNGDEITAGDVVLKFRQG